MLIQRLYNLCYTPRTQRHLYLGNGRANQDLQCGTSSDWARGLRTGPQHHNRYVRVPGEKPHEQLIGEGERAEPSAVWGSNWQTAVERQPLRFFSD
jgi:hypothetical protein